MENTMAIIPNHTYVNAYFVNDARTTVEILLEDNDTKEIRTQHCEAADNNAIWKELLEIPEITIDKLHENTHEYIKYTQQYMQDMALVVAKERGLVYDYDVDANIYKAAVNFLFGKGDPETTEDLEKEKLFLYKLSIFEQESIKSSTDRELKKDLRKAPSILEATKIAIQILESNESD